MNQPCSWPPLPGSYRTGQPDAVAIVSLRSGVGPLHLRVPVSAATLVVKRKLSASRLEVDLDGPALRSSAPLPIRRSVDRLLGEALKAVRLETFAVEELGPGRLRGHADLYAGGGSTQVQLDIRMVEVTPSSLRVSVRTRVPRAALGLGHAALLAGPWARLAIALHATATAPAKKTTKPRALAGAVA